MNVSLNWLQTHLDLSKHSIQELDDLLTFAGVEVEGIEQRGLSTELVVVAQIKEATQHPDADRLKVCQVDAGEGALRQIVCGAQNYKVGDKVPCALPGADLGGGFVIKEGKLRGVESRGMLCGASEIGLVDEEDGLMILPEDAVIGTKLIEMFDADTLIEVEITPNRPDLLSHTGMARELSALTHLPRKKLQIQPITTTAATAEDITLSKPELCPFYTATRISGITVKESPAWLQERLDAIGLRPINNIVDITNYVLHELGHPLHAFDATKVSGALDIRSAKDGEAFSALTGEEVTLSTEDLLISDAAGNPLALAGIMGGLDSGVTDTTTDIILEAAYFNPSSTRRTSRKTAISSDSSYRFERGSDPQQVASSAALAIQLIQELAGGTVEATKCAGSAPILTQPVQLDIPRLEQLMGGNISLDQAKAILSQLGLEEMDDNFWNIPSYRLDLTRHIDLVEEIARVHGLDNIKPRLQGTFADESAQDHSYDFQLKVKRQLAARGFFEAQTIKLISEHNVDQTVAQLKDALPLRPLIDGDLISVALPLSQDHAIMRPSLVPGLVAVAARNLAKGARSLRFFEIGRQFRNAGGGKAKDLEADSLALLLSGENAPKNWAHTKPSIQDFFDLKGSIAALLPRATVQLKPREREGFVLGADLLADGKPIGVVAQLSPSRCREINSPHPIYVAEIDMAKMQHLCSADYKFEELPQFPGSSRDAAIEAPIELSNADIEQALKKHNESLLIEFQCNDIFTDPTAQKIAANKKSMTYSFLYRSPDKTLKAKQVDEAHQKLLDALKTKLDISYR